MMKKDMACIQNVSNSIKFFLLCAICATSIQCNNRSNSFRLAIDDIRYLNPATTSRHEELASVMRLCYLGDKYIVSFYRDTMLLGIVDTSFQLKTRFVRRGRGPGELLAPYITGQISSENGEQTVNVFDRASNRLLYYSIDTFGNPRLVKTDSLSMHHGDMRIAYLTANGFWGILDNNSQSIFTADKTGTHLNLHEIHKHDNSSNDFQSIVTANQDYTLFALAYFAMPKIDILGQDGKRLLTIDIDGLPNNLEYENDYFIDIQSTPDLIYALLNYSDQNDIILCIDWEGNLKDIFGVCKSESLCLLNNSTVLTSSHDFEGLIITQYVLP